MLTSRLVAVGDGSSPRGGNNRSKSVIIRSSPRASDGQQILVRKCESPNATIPEDEESSSSSSSPIPLPLPLSLSLSVGHHGGSSNNRSKVSTVTTDNAHHHECDDEAISSSNAPADLSMVGAKLTLQNLRVCGLSTTTSLITVPISEIVHSVGLSSSSCCAKNDGKYSSSSSNSKIISNSSLALGGASSHNKGSGSSVTVSRSNSSNATQSLVVLGNGNSGSRRAANNSSSSVPLGSGASSNNFKFACYICGHEYPRESTLRNHLKVYHKIELANV